MFTIRLTSQEALHLSWALGRLMRADLGSYGDQAIGILHGVKPTVVKYCSILSDMADLAYD